MVSEMTPCQRTKKLCACPNPNGGSHEIAPEDVDRTDAAARPGVKDALQIPTILIKHPTMLSDRNVFEKIPHGLTIFNFADQNRCHPDWLSNGGLWSIMFLVSLA